METKEKPRKREAAEAPSRKRSAARPEESRKKKAPEKAAAEQPRRRRPAEAEQAPRQRQERPVQSRQRPADNRATRQNASVQRPPRTDNVQFAAPKGTGPRKSAPQMSAGEAAELRRRQRTKKQTIAFPIFIARNLVHPSPTDNLMLIIIGLLMPMPATICITLV